MHIPGIFAGAGDLAAFGRAKETTDGAVGPASEAQESRGPSSAATTALAEILARHDVTDITPAEFSSMIQKLFEAGAISESELQQLTAIRHDLDTEGVEPDESLDLLDFYARRIRRQQRQLEDVDGQPAAHQQLGPALRRLDWLEKFALIHEAPDAIGLNAVA